MPSQGWPPVNGGDVTRGADLPIRCAAPLAAIGNGRITEVPGFHAAWQRPVAESCLLLVPIEPDAFSGRRPDLFSLAHTLRQPFDAPQVGIKAAESDLPAENPSDGSELRHIPPSPGHADSTI